MIRIVGNKIVLYGLLLMCCALSLDARITMEINSENSIPNQVIIGQPFTLEVLIDDVYGSVSNPMIKGLEGCFSRLTGTYMTNINGKSTTRYSYTVRIDKLGEYILGPAIVTHQKQKLISNELHICVVTDTGIVAQKNKNNTQTVTKAFLRLMVDTEIPFVGQKMSCSLRFYYQDTSISLHNIGIPELSGFDIKEISKIETGTTEIDGVTYHYAQWRWDMYPIKPGEFIIPAYHADYDIPLKDNNHLLSGFFIFMGNRVDRKRVYSNALTIKVLPLPHYDGPINAVGLFEGISADIKPGIAKEGEGMVLTIELQGVGNLPAITMPKLKLPESLKYYDSHHTISMPEHIDELPKKKFEFIVQAMKSGDYEIPAQLFTYFDIEKKDYITLHTYPLAISIKPNVIPIKKDTIQEETNEIFIHEDNELAPLNEKGQWYPVAERQPLPWRLFELLFLLPVLYRGYPLLSRRLCMLADNWTGLRRRRALNKARKKVESCKKNSSNKELYTIFVQLFKEYNDSVDIHSLETLLKKSMSHDHILEWNLFLERITQAAYTHSNNNDTNELCRMAQQWLDCLEKKI